MALYWKLRTIENPAHRIHVAERLRALRAQLAEEVTDKTSEHDLRLATWNLMHFGNGGGYWRNTDALLYISEIIDHFDLVAVQEVNRNLAQLEDLTKNYLGKEWDYIVTDTSEGKGGNKERMAFLYRSGKVNFTRLAGEVVLPDGQTIAGSAGIDRTFSDETTLNPFAKHHQFARTPFVVGFQCGWFTFRLCTVHIYFGSNPKQPDNMPDDAYEEMKGQFMDVRKAEIRQVARFFAKRQKSERRAEKKALKAKGWNTDQSEANYILLGDFNVVSPQHETMKALTEEGFIAPDGMEDLPTTLGKAVGYYDQIVHRIADARIQHGLSGTVDFRKSVFREEDADHYIDVVKDAFVTEPGRLAKGRAAMRTYFKRYRLKHQMSDHQLLWSSFKVDLADRYLERIEREAERELDDQPTG